MIDRVSVSQDDEREWWLEFYADDIRYGVSLADVLAWQEAAQQCVQPDLRPCGHSYLSTVHNAITGETYCGECGASVVYGFPTMRAPDRVMGSANFHYSPLMAIPPKVKASSPHPAGNASRRTVTMKKIISLFKRDYEGTRQVFNEVLSGAEWVTNGEGVATVKIDGTSCLVRDGKLFKRYDAKAGKTPPAGFEPAQEPDPITGHYPGWLPVSENDNGDRWHREAFAQYENLADGTYELIGEKVQGNPYGITGHKLIRHGEWFFESEPPRTFDELKKWFETNNVEGIVWHHPSGDMVKIKRKDFGFKWGGSVSKSAT